MRIESGDGRIRLYPEGALNSVNASELEKEIFAALKAEPGAEVEADCEKLTSISSVGLRLMLKIHRETGGRLKVRNLSSEVYETIEVTGLTTILDARRRMREISVEGCPVIGKGAFGTVYRIDEDTIVKVYSRADFLPMIENEQKRARQAFLRGIPTAIPFDIVKVGDAFGAVFEMVKAQNCNDLLIANPEKTDEIISLYVDFLKSLHAIRTEPGEFPDQREVYLGYLNELGDRLPEKIRSRAAALLKAMPEELRLIHGDIQLKNLMYSDGNLTLIDMDTLCSGNPVFEFAGLYMSYIAFSIHEPDNTLGFYGMSREQCRAIFADTFRQYTGCTEGKAGSAWHRTETVSLIRFMYVIALLGYGPDELRQVRVDYCIRRLGELTETVDSLAI